MILPTIIIALMAAQANGLPDEQPFDLGGWAIAESGPSCVATMDYKGDGRTRLSLIRYLDGATMLFIGNQNWLVEDGTPHQLTALIDGMPFSKEGTGIIIEDLRGYLVEMPPEFLTKFSQGSWLGLIVDGQPVEKLTLTGTLGAVAMTGVCLTVADSRMPLTNQVQATPQT